MKVMVIGGVHEDKGSVGYASSLYKLSQASLEIGRSLALKGHKLIVCSPFPDSADFHVLKGAASVVNPVMAHIFFPAEQIVTSEISGLKASIGDVELETTPIPGPYDTSSSESWKHCWLLAQLSAMEQADVVITLSGRPAGSMSFLLPLAEIRNKPILPFAFLGGLSEQFLDKNVLLYRDRLGAQLDALLVPEGAQYAGDLCSLVSTRPRTISNPKFFLSYAKARPAEADFVEMVLRRRNLTVFRDDGNFAAGTPVQSQIVRFIDESDVFIAVWCQDYACSPWCFDELDYALSRERRGQLTIWIVPVDSTRIVPPGARDKLRFDVYSSRDQLEGRLVKEIERLTLP